MQKTKLKQSCESQIVLDYCGITLLFQGENLSPKWKIRIYSHFCISGAHKDFSFCSDQHDIKDGEDLDGFFYFSGYDLDLRLPLWM